jgi:UDP-N-acetylglucosamine 1-carboxyvinyltransferase
VSRGVQPFELACGTHPGVISDMQPFYVLLALAAQGRSRVFDYRYPERIDYVAELAKLCGEGSLSAKPGAIVIDGGRGFRPAEVRSTDLRGSMALLLAALCAPGESRVERLDLALRGYDDLERKLAGIGVPIEVTDA